MSTATTAADVAWIQPAARPAAADALLRIQALCEAFPDLFSATFVVVATHPGVPREWLAMAIRRFHAEARGLADADMLGLTVATGNGARQAFDAVLNTRRNAARRGRGALAWLPADD